jgi:hypothetical protein
VPSPEGVAEPRHPIAAHRREREFGSHSCVHSFTTAPSQSPPPTDTSTTASPCGRRCCFISSTGPEDFDSVLRTIEQAHGGSAELLPSRLAEAVVRVLPADGAGISVRAGEHARIPIGASDHASATAESLEFTVGEGPCLDAISFGDYVEASLHRLEDRWPVLADSWIGATPFRSVAATPVWISAAIPGSLNLYFRSDDGSTTVDRSAVAEVSRCVTAELAKQRLLAADDADELVRNLTSSARGRVWVAVGTLIAAHGSEALDALDRMRSFATSRETTVDDVADDLLHDRIDVIEFAP